MYGDVAIALVENSYKGFVLGAIPALLPAGVIYIAARLLGKTSDHVTTAMAFATFGTVCGILVGASRQPVVGAFLPLILPMVTLFVTFIVEKKGDAQLRATYMLSLIAFFYRNLLWRILWSVHRWSARASQENSI